MGIFGWSYPPGCYGLPWDDNFFCEICGARDDSDCVCPECPECSSIGDPLCYKDHGLVRSQEQTDAYAKYLEWEEGNQYDEEPEDHADWDDDILKEYTWDEKNYDVPDDVAEVYAKRNHMETFLKGKAENE